MVIGVVLVSRSHLLGKSRPLGRKGCLLAGKACNRETGYNFMQCISPDITSWTISDIQKSMSEVKVNFLILGVII